jgi:phage/conjugal plasmid C-4 type zinc finger TraR family protein
MSDFADLASAQEQLDRDTALAARPMFGGESLATCEDCGNPIPLKRQHAIAGVRLCVDCQAALEVCNR